MRLTQKIITLASGGLGAIVLTAVTIKPEDADSNLAAWMNAVGVENPPSALVSTHADQLAFWLSILLLAIFAIGLSEWIFNRGWITQHISWRFRLKPPQVTPAITDQVNAITPASHKGKPLVRLTEPERLRVSEALLAVGDYLKGDFADFLRPYQEMRAADAILRAEGGAAYHAKVEAPRSNMRAFIDGMMDAIKPYEDELLLLGLDVSIIKTKATPLWDAVRQVSNVSQMLGPEQANGEALKLPLRQLGEVVEAIQVEVGRVQNDITLWRLKISRGEL